MRVLIAVTLVVLLASPCYAQAIRAGYAKEDITPSEPVQLGGYSLCTGLSEGVYEGDRLFVRALCFNDGATSVLFVESDLIGAPGARPFATRSPRRPAFPRFHILFGDEHNHAAPMPKPDGQSAFDPRYGEAIASAAKKAVAALQPVRIAAGEGRSRVAMNRRQIRPADVESASTFDENHVSQSFGSQDGQAGKVREFGGVVRLGANPTGPIDDAVQLVRIDDMAGKPLALMIHYACHGTSLGGRNAKVSGEWMGRAVYAEKHFPGLGTMFIRRCRRHQPPPGRRIGRQQNDIRTAWALGEEISPKWCASIALDPQPSTPASNWSPRKSNCRGPIANCSWIFATRPCPCQRRWFHRAAMWVSFPGEMFRRSANRKGGLPRPIRPPDGLYQRQHRLLPHARSVLPGRIRAGHQPPRSDGRVGLPAPDRGVAEALPLTPTVGQVANLSQRVGICRDRLATCPTRRPISPPKPPVRARYRLPHRLNHAEQQ